MARLRPSGLLRSLLVALLALAGIVAVAATAGANSQTGTHGHVVFTDSSASVGATCVYGDGYASHFLSKFTVKPPSIWWPNTTPSSNTEHGTVGWQVLVQESPSNSIQWSTKMTSSVVTGTAYEDHPTHDAADKAKFSTRTIKYAGSATDQLFRVVTKAIWYNADQSVMGTVSHVVGHYRLTSTGYTNTGSGCPGEIVILG